LGTSGRRDCLELILGSQTIDADGCPQPKLPLSVRYGDWCLLAPLRGARGPVGAIQPGREFSSDAGCGGRLAETTDLRRGSYAEEDIAAVGTYALLVAGRDEEGWETPKASHF